MAMAQRRCRGGDGAAVEEQAMEGEKEDERGEEERNPNLEENGFTLKKKKKTADKRKKDKKDGQEETMVIRYSELSFLDRYFHPINVN
jgi:hypothetical protein